MGTLSEVEGARASVLQRTGVPTGNEPASSRGNVDNQGSGRSPTQKDVSNQQADSDLLSNRLTAKLFAERVPFARKPETGPPPESGDDIYLSQDASEAVLKAQEAVQLARGFVRDTVAGAIRNAAGDFLRQLGAVAGNPVLEDEQALANTAQKIGQTAADKAEELSEKLLEETGQDDFSFREIKLTVVVETFDLRVADDEKSADVKMKRVSLRVEIEEVQGSLTKKEERIQLDFDRGGGGVPKPAEGPNADPVDSLLDPEKADPLTRSLDDSRGDLKNVLKRLEEERTGLNQDFLGSISQSLGDAFDQLFGGPVSNIQEAGSRLQVRPELTLFEQGGETNTPQAAPLDNLEPGRLRQLDV